MRRYFYVGKSHISYSETSSQKPFVYNKRSSVYPSNNRKESQLIRSTSLASMTNVALHLMGRRQLRTSKRQCTPAQKHDQEKKKLHSGRWSIAENQKLQESSQC